MALRPENLNKIEREAVYLLREAFSSGREASLDWMEAEEAAYVKALAELALYPEKPLLSFDRERPDEEEENIWNPKERDVEFFRRARMFHGKTGVRKLITCGGVDDGKSTLIGRILFDAKSPEEQTHICQNPAYLRKDNSVDYALLAGTSEEEARQGITVQVSYSMFDWEDNSFLMADVPGHEEYTRNMAYAASQAETAIIMVAANKGIVPQTRRHTRICRFMGIVDMIFAINKMDMVDFSQKAFLQLSEEIAHMMEEYQDCRFQIVPISAKSGVNISEKSKDMAWYPGGTLLEALKRKRENEANEAGYFCMPVQRTCKSSQMIGASVKKRVIQGEALSGNICVGDEVLLYPTMAKAKISGMYCFAKKVKSAAEGDAIGVELDRELDAARGYILTKEDVLTFTDRLEADVLWTFDNRLTQGKRYRVKIASAVVTAVVTKICYQTDVNTGEHRYAEYLTKNAMARLELCFPKQIAVSCEKDNRRLGSVLLIDRETDSLAAYGNIVHTISNEAWKEDGREVLAQERESALGQKAGLILFGQGNSVEENMNYTERYLLRMGFHTVQIADGGIKADRSKYIRKFLDAGLIVLLQTKAAEKEKMMSLLEDEKRIFDCTKASGDTNDLGRVLRKIQSWASELI